MQRQELSDTLIALVEGLRPVEGSGLIVTEAEMDVPLELTGAVRGGRLVVLGGVPHTRWVSGVLPPVHLSRLRVALVDSGTGADASEADADG